jgi:hypothetical protein
MSCVLCLRKGFSLDKRWRLIGEVVQSVRSADRAQPPPHWLPIAREDLPMCIWGDEPVGH